MHTTVFCNLYVTPDYFQSQTWQAVGPRCARTAEKLLALKKRKENVPPHPKAREERRSSAFFFSPCKTAHGLALNRVSECAEHPGSVSYDPCVTLTIVLI